MKTSDIIFQLQRLGTWCWKMLQSALLLSRYFLCSFIFELNFKFASSPFITVLEEKKQFNIFFIITFAIYLCEDQQKVIINNKCYMEAATIHGIFLKQINFQNICTCSVFIRCKNDNITNWFIFTFCKFGCLLYCNYFVILSFSN